MNKFPANLRKRKNQSARIVPYLSFQAGNPYTFLASTAHTTPLSHGANTFRYAVWSPVCLHSGDKIRYMKVPFQRTINVVLAATALLAGWWSFRWAGLALAITVMAFWSILQFNRASRQLRNVADRPKGMVDSVVTLQSKLAYGMHMPDVLAISNSLGQRVNERGNDWLWRDSYGNQIVVTFRRGSVERWSATRTDGQNASPVVARPAAVPDTMRGVEHAAAA
jgi:hypothetical protein